MMKVGVKEVRGEDFDMRFKGAKEKVLMSAGRRNSEEASDGGENDPGNEQVYRRKSSTPGGGSSKISELKVLANGNVMKVQKTRQRKILSCVYCHSKKIKCSRQHPVCNNCEKLGIGCKYFVNERVSRGGKVSARLSIKEKGTRGSVSRESVSSTEAFSPTSKTGNSIASLSDDITPPSEEQTIEENLVSPEFEKHQAPHVMSDISLNYLDLNLGNLNSGAISVNSRGGEQNHGSGSENTNNQDMNPGNRPSTEAGSPVITNSLLQTPIMNNLSNNITNNFFNTNYSNQNPQNMGDDQYSFNLSSFTLAGQEGLMNMSTNSPQNNNSPSSSNISSLFNRNANNFIDRNTNGNEHNGNLKVINNTSGNENGQGSLSSVTSQPNNPGLHNSLNAYSSNPATTVNYLYGTNTEYCNEDLIECLVKVMPPKERSYELIERYMSSVHILLPIVVNIADFIKEHNRYWEQEAMGKSPASYSSNNSGSNGGSNFDVLQFYTLYFPILYASTISEFEEYDNLLLNQDINKYLKSFNKICQYYNYPHGLKTIPLLLGNVIIQSTSPNPSTMEMSQIIRYAKFLQIHKDPIITLRINDWEVVKFRRLLWWVIFGLDALTSHNFCLPPLCRFDDFNVLMPDEEEPIFNENGTIKEKKLNSSILSMNVKFKFDIILSELVYELHNGLSANISNEKIKNIKELIIQLFEHIHSAIARMGAFYKVNPPSTVQEMNIINFIKNHSWSFVDRALMLLHKKILLTDTSSNESKSNGYEINMDKSRGGILSLSQYEDTFGRIQEANIIDNFNNSSISLLKFNQFESFSYEKLSNNLIPSILHNLNDFLKYNDFIKFGKFNWYVKRTIPLDSIILMFIIITVKFKYEFISIDELMIYVKLINKALFILNRKWFKNEKYKRMLSLTNLTWEYILKKFNIVNTIKAFSESENGTDKDQIEFFDYQVTGYMNLNELFNVMDVPQPIVNQLQIEKSHHGDVKGGSEPPSDSPSSLGFPRQNTQRLFSNTLVQNRGQLSNDVKTELIQMNEKIYYDLRNNYVDINDYCAFYVSLENILHELMDYVNKD